MDDWVHSLDLSKPHDQLKKEIDKRLNDTRVLWGLIGMVIGLFLAAAVL